MPTSEGAAAVSGVRDVSAVSGTGGGAEGVDVFAAFCDAWEIFAEAALAGGCAGAILGVLGVWVVLRRLVFLSAALAQAAGFGVAAAFWLRASLPWALPPTLARLGPLIGAMAATLLASGAVGRALAPSIRRPGQAREGVLGFIYLFAAAATLAVGTRIVQDVHDIQSLLFGSAVAVSPGDLRLLAGLAGVGMVALALTWRGLQEACADPIGARLRGLPVGALDRGLWWFLALAVSVSTHVLGAMPVFAFSVLPGMAALAVCRNVAQAQVVAALAGASAGLVGYLLAFLAELPVGASQTLVATAQVALAWTLRGLRRRHAA